MVVIPIFPVDGDQYVWAHYILASRMQRTVHTFKDISKINANIEGKSRKDKVLGREQIEGTE